MWRLSRSGPGCRHGDARRPTGDRDRRCERDRAGDRACAWSRKGASVAIVDVDGDATAATAAELGLAGFVADVSDPEACTRAINDAAAALGGLTVLFNNAGVGAAMPLHKYSDAAWAKLVGVNLTGTFHGIRAAVPLMREHGGSIVNHASVSGVRPTRFEGPYSAAKAGVISLTMDAALEYAPSIRVNCVSPGIIETNLTAMVLDDDVMRARVEAATPLGRVGTAAGCRERRRLPRVAARRVRDRAERA